MKDNFDSCPSCCYVDCECELRWNKGGGNKAQTTNKIPESGQFVAVWRIRGKVWSNTYQIESGKVYSYVPNIQANPWLYVCNKDEFIKIMPGGLEIIQ